MISITLNLLIYIIIFVLLGIISYDIYRTFNINKKYKMRKNPQIKKTPKVECQKKEVSFDKDKLIINYYKKIIKLKHCNLDFFYNNIATLKLDKRPTLRKHNISANYYLINKNIISLTDDDSISHELTHMSTSCYDKPDSFCGFSQDQLANGLNEGYTELISRRYFDSDRYSYIAEVKIANNLERIVGKEKMEQLFFEANLYELIEMLSKYDSKDNVLKFINSIDFISEVIDDSWMRDRFIKKIKRSLKFVNLCMLKWYVLKQKELYDKKKITYNGLISKIKNFSENLTSIKDMDDNIYKVLDNDEIKEEVKKILK